MKKIFSLLGGICIVALFAISCTFAYTQEQQEAYQWAYKYGLTTQPTIEQARMNSPLTRQAFAKMVVNYLENVVWVKQSPANSCYFPDEYRITDNLIPYTKKTCAYKIMWSDWKKFSPTQIVDRAQLWTVFSRILWWDEYNNTWKGYYIYHLNALKFSGIMNDISDPVGSYAKRWDVMIMFKRVYEKFGSTVHLNGNQTNAYSIQKSFFLNQSVDRGSSDNEYIASVYNNSTVVYVWKDGTKYYYDDKFLNMLKDVANKQWESDLAKYLEIESNYFKDWLDQLSDLDDEEIIRAMWIDIDNLDVDKMTDKEKENLVKKFKAGFGKIIDENKNKNNKLLKDLEKVTKNISNDKFWLKEKYKKTKAFMEASNTFMDVYSESLFNLIELALSKWEDELWEEWMTQAIYIIWVAFTYQWESDAYQKFVEEWAVSTIKLLGLD